MHHINCLYYIDIFYFHGDTETIALSLSSSTQKVSTFEYIIYQYIIMCERCNKT